MRAASLFLPFCILSFAAWANGDPALKLQLGIPQEEYILGIRPECTLKWINLQDKPLVLAFSVASDSPLAKVHIQGAQRRDCFWTHRMAETKHDAHEELKARETKREEGILGDKGLVEIGDYEAWVEYDSTAIGDYWLQWGAARIKTESNHVRFRIVSPRGEDAAIQAKHGNKCHQIALSKAEILRLYPTSTYAAYTIFDLIIGFQYNNWRMAAEAIETGSYNNNSYPDETGQNKDGWQRLKGEEAARWWDKWIGIILKNRPDIWFADQLKLKRAIDLVAMKKYDAGAADLQVLARDAKEPVSSAAREFLAIMREKGWIKPEAATPEKAAPPSPSTPAPAKPSGGGS